jgi:proteasome lid subunit RPN8/RPN11
VKWTEQVELERIAPLSSLGDTCGAALTLELLTWAQERDLCAWFSPATRAEIHRYLRRFSVESGGLLLGRRYGPIARAEVVTIEMFVPGTDFNGTGVSLALGTKVWDDARVHLDAGFSVVGWVHSHPNLGAFFSGTDRRTQRAFFSKAWQIGLCVDPVRNESAWFYGAESLCDGIVVVE